MTGHELVPGFLRRRYREVREPRAQQEAETSLALYPTTGRRALIAHSLNNKKTPPRWLDSRGLDSKEQSQ